MKTSLSLEKKTLQPILLMTFEINYSKGVSLNPPTFGTFIIQVDAPFETIRYCGFEW